MEAIVLSSINYSRLPKNSLQVSGWANSQGNIKCLKDLKGFQSSIPQSYCTDIRMKKKKKKKGKTLQWFISNDCTLLQFLSTSRTLLTVLFFSHGQVVYEDEVASSSRKYRNCSCIQWKQSQWDQSHNILSQKGPTRIIKYSSWLHTGPPKNKTICLESIDQILLEWCCDQIPGEPVQVPNYPLSE